MSILSDARLNRDYPSKILQAISLTDDANPLILRYVRTAKPVLTEPIDIDTYTIALAGSSLLEAWQFQRTFPEVSDTRPRLVQKILEWCLSRGVMFVTSLCFAKAWCLLSTPTAWASRPASGVPILELRTNHHSQIRPSTSLHSPSIVGTYNTRPCLCPANSKWSIRLCNKARSSIRRFNNPRYHV